MCPSTPKVKAPKPAPVQPPVAPTQAPEVNVGSKDAPSKRKKISRTDLSSGATGGKPSAGVGY